MAMVIDFGSRLQRLKNQQEKIEGRLSGAWFTERDYDAIEKIALLALKLFPLAATRGEFNTCFDQVSKARARLITVYNGLPKRSAMTRMRFEYLSQRIAIQLAQISEWLLRAWATPCPELPLRFPSIDRFDIS